MVIPSLPDLRRYRHLLLDMNGTFLFDFDRFGMEEDFGQTYLRLGYKTLTGPEAHTLVRAAYDYMAVRYIDENFYHDFPTVEDAIGATAGKVLPKGLIPQLVHTFQEHEFGHLPLAHFAALQNLARRKPISVLSNLWSPGAAWLEYFDQIGLRQNLACIHFSSAGKEMKPHPNFFNRALASIGFPASEVLFIGDSYRCDVEGARNVGMDVVWLHGKNALPDRLPSGVFAVPGLLELAGELEKALQAE